MTVTKRGSGFALNGDENELTEALNLLETYIQDDASWAHNARRRPAMMARAAGYRRLRERLGVLAGEEVPGGLSISRAEMSVASEQEGELLSLISCAFERCGNQINVPEDRIFCRLCGVNFCVQHGNPEAHRCPGLPAEMTLNELVEA